MRLICAYFASLLSRLQSTDPSTIGTTGPSSPTIAATRRPTKSSNGSGSVSVLGRLNESLVYFNSPLVPPVYLSMVSRISKALMDREDLLSRSLVILWGCQEAIRVLIGWIYHPIKIMRAWRVSCYLLLSECCFFLLVVRAWSLMLLSLPQRDGRFRAGVILLYCVFGISPLNSDDREYFLYQISSIVVYIILLRLSFPI